SRLDLGLQAGAIITGNIMALLPGRPLVSSLQDGISGSYVSSSARLLEDFFTLGAIISGVGAVAYTAVRLGVGMDLDNLPSTGSAVDPWVLIRAAGIAVAIAVSLTAPPLFLPAIGVMGAFFWLFSAGARADLVSPAMVGAVAGAGSTGMIGHKLARR